MLVKIDRKEMSAANYACTLSDHKINFYTIESNDKMVQLEILTYDGGEPSNNMIFHIARLMETKLACEAFARKAN